MDIAEILRHILIVLVAAKLAAEVAERIGVPAVVGEIVAGILVGPSVLNAVGGNDEVLRTLGEIGVILLLLDVGMEMDLRELGKVGKTSMLVATVGVIIPMVLGMVAMGLMGEEFNLPGKPTLEIRAAGTAPIVKLDIVCNNAYVYGATPNTETVGLRWTDAAQPRDEHMLPGQSLDACIAKQDMGALKLRRQAAGSIRHDFPGVQHE